MNHIYYSRLDGIRFVAIIMVIIAHFASSISKHISSAFYGVNLFFVLSGYLITGILIASKNNSFKKSYSNFVFRRALRIFPAYYLSLFILFIIGEDFIQNDMPYLLTYSYNYFIDHSKPLPSHLFYWSLAVEEQFYLIFPLIVIALKNHIKFLILVILFIITLAYLQVFTNLFNALCDKFER